MDQAPENDSDQPLVTYLKRLVTAMAIVMIAGFVVLIGTLVIRLNADPIPLPDRVTLPAGVSAVAFTQGTDWYAVVTDADTILIYDRGTGALTQTVSIDH
jgi:hypothetical protein